MVEGIPKVFISCLSPSVTSNSNECNIWFALSDGNHASKVGITLSWWLVQRLKTNSCMGMTPFIYVWSFKIYVWGLSSRGFSWNHLSAETDVTIKEFLFTSSCQKFLWDDKERTRPRRIPSLVELIQLTKSSKQNKQLDGKGRCAVCRMQHNKL